MPTLNAIRGQEPSTVSFKVRTITQLQNSTAMHQEVLTIGGTESTLALAAVIAAAPVSTTWGLVTRPVWSSTHADQPVQAAQASTTWAIQATAVEATLGSTGGAKVITDANGTLQQYLRGLIYLLITTASRPEKAVYGTTTTVINTATDIAAGNFSGAPAATFDNTTDAAVPYARWAKAVGSFPDWAAAPVAGTTVDLYGLLIDVDGTNDDTQAPASTADGGGRYFGSFVISADDALQRRTITIDLLGVEKVDFYIKNNTAQNMNNDAGTNAIVKITPLAYGVVI